MIFQQIVFLNAPKNEVYSGVLPQAEGVLNLPLDDVDTLTD